MKITWYGTATVGIDDGTTKLLFDPFVRMNKKIETTPVEGFAGADAVFITHGHFDHIYSIPELARADERVPFYCTAVPAKTLADKGVVKDRIRVIKPDDVIEAGAFTVRVHRFRHVVFDPCYILSVVPKCALMLPKLIWQFYINHFMPEGGEIVAYEIDAHGKKIFLTGSFREHPDGKYPENADLFILAHGGTVFMPEKTKDFVKKYHPKKIMVDHFDDAFPPLTRNVDVGRLERTIRKNHPDIEFIVPEICKPFEL